MLDSTETGSTALPARFATATPTLQTRAQEIPAPIRCLVAAMRDTTETEYDAHCAGRVLRTAPCSHLAPEEKPQTMSPANATRASLATVSIAQCAERVISML